MLKACKTVLCRSLFGVFAWSAIALLVVSMTSDRELAVDPTEMVEMPAQAQEVKEVVVPGALKPGSRIALITPALSVDSIVVARTMQRLRKRGYVPVPMTHTFGYKQGGHASDIVGRKNDLMAAFADPSIDAILCMRGGFGCMPLLPMLDQQVIVDNPKWLIGFSDVSAVHALLTRLGVASIHGPMGANIAQEPANDLSAQYLFDILEQGLPKTYVTPSHPYNRIGTASGRLLGGNLTVVNGLAQTENDVIRMAEEQDVILFFEEVGEKISAVERVLFRLHQSGVLKHVRGLIFGHFTEYKPNSDYRTVEDMLHDWLRKWGYYEGDMPIVFNFPIGHTRVNYPLVVGVQASLDVRKSGVKLTMGE